MGQKIDKPSTQTSYDRADETRWQILRQSAKILIWTDGRVNAEEKFIQGYEDPWIIADKIDRWLDFGLDSSTCLQDVRLEKAIDELANELNRKMRRDYEIAYVNLNKAAKLTDELAWRQRKIHKELLDLEDLKVERRPGKKFCRKLARLRNKVLANASMCEKIEHRDVILRDEFFKKVRDIDQENMERCGKKVRRLIEDWRRNWSPES